MSNLSQISCTSLWEVWVKIVHYLEYVNVKYKKIHRNIFVHKEKVGKKYFGFFVQFFSFVNRTKIKGGCQSGRKGVHQGTKSDLPLATFI